MKPSFRFITLSISRLASVFLLGIGMTLLAAAVLKKRTNGETNDRHVEATLNALLTQARASQSLR